MALNNYLLKFIPISIQQTLKYALNNGQLRYAKHRNQILESHKKNITTLNPLLPNNRV
jgi:hypothetical protein